MRLRFFDQFAKWTDTDRARSCKHEKGYLRRAARHSDCSGSILARLLDYRGEAGAARCTARFARISLPEIQGLSFR